MTGERPVRVPAASRGCGRFCQLILCLSAAVVCEREKSIASFECA